MHTHTHAHACTHTHSCTHACTHMHATHSCNTLMHTHARTHMHAHTRMHRPGTWPRLIHLSVSVPVSVSLSLLFAFKSLYFLNNCIHSLFIHSQESELLPRSLTLRLQAPNKRLKMSVPGQGRIYGFGRDQHSSLCPPTSQAAGASQDRRAVEKEVRAGMERERSQERAERPRTEPWEVLRSGLQGRHAYEC